MVQACVRAGAGAARGLCPAAAAAAPSAKQPQQQRGLRCPAGMSSSREIVAPIRWTRTPSSDHHPRQQQQRRRRRCSLRPTASSDTSSSSTSDPATSTDDTTSTSSITNGHALSSSSTAPPPPPPPPPASATGNNNVYRWTDPNPTRPRIAILGGGFGGLYTALQLDHHLPWATGTRPQILLIDQSDRFVFKPLLYELVGRGADAWEVAPRFQDLLAPAPSVRFLRATVARVQSAGFGGTTALGGPGAGTVTLASGAVVEYDWLVLALGAEARVDAAPGARAHAVAFATLEDALELDRRLLALERARFGKSGGEGIRVVVVGSGYSGVELAATVAERVGSRGSVTVVDAAREVCKGAAEGNRVAAEKGLAARGVKLDLGQAVTKISKKEGGVGGGDVDGDGLGPVVVHLERVVGDGGGSWTETKEVEADLVLWTAGVKPLVPPSESSPAAPPAFPTTGRGQADTDACLRVKGHPRVFAIGDSAAATDPATGAPLPATAQVAFQQAEQAGYNLWAAITGRRPRPFRYTHLGEMMTLGRYDGAVTPAVVVPGLGGAAVTLDGLAGHAARRLAYLLRLPTAEHRAKVGVSWFVKAAVDGVAAAQDAVAGLLAQSSSRSSSRR